MKKIFRFLCGIFMFLCITQQQSNAEELEWAQKARNNPAAIEKYNKIAAELEKRRERKKQEELERQEQATKYDDDGLEKIEAKLLDRDIDGARHELKKASFGWQAKYDAETVIDCVYKILEFYTYLNQKKDTQTAITLYAPTMQTCNVIPEPIPFTEKLAKEINSALAGAEKFINKECGKDYGTIRVGMTLKRANKCYGELYHHGQTRYKGGTVEYYTRGETYVYAINGKIVAWGN